MLLQHKVSMGGSGWGGVGVGLQCGLCLQGNEQYMGRVEMKHLPHVVIADVVVNTFTTISHSPWIPSP